VTLYDLTNTFSKVTRRQPKAQRGRSKEKRSDCRWSRWAWCSMGVVSCAGRGPLRQCQRGQHAGGDAGRARGPAGALVIMDAGIATAANLRGGRAALPLFGGSPWGQRQFDAARRSASRRQRGDGAAAAGAQCRRQRGLLYCHSQRREARKPPSWRASRSGSRLAWQDRCRLQQPRGEKRRDRLLARWPPAGAKPGRQSALHLAAHHRWHG